MPNNRPKLLSAIINDLQPNTLSQIHEKTILLQKINQAIAMILPKEFYSWCRVANIRQHILIIETANASWLMRLRYERHHLLSALRASILPSLATIDILINPSLMEKQAKSSGKIAKKIKKVNQLSINSVENLRCLADKSPLSLKLKIEQLAKLIEERINN